MLELICEWLYENAMAIFISAFASLLISKMYFDKANRESVLMTVIFPIVKLLDGNFYTRKDYETLFDLNSTYAIKYLRKKERNKLLALLSAYRDVCRYSKESADTSCIMSYYSHKLRKNGINPKPCVIKDNDGQIVADDFPPDYNYLQDYVYKIISSYDFIESPGECSIKIADAFKSYTKKYYTNEEILYFDDYSIHKVIELSEISKKWDDKFKLADNSKEEFLKLPICKKVINIIHDSNVNKQLKSKNNKKYLKLNEKGFSIKDINELKDSKYSSIYVVVCLIEQAVVLEALKDIDNLIANDDIYMYIYCLGGIISFIIMIAILKLLIKRAKLQIEEQTANRKTDKWIECATMIGYLSPILCVSTWFSLFESFLVAKWVIIALVHILGIGIPLLVKKKK